MKYETRVLSVTVVPSDDSGVIGEYGTTITIDDEGAGEFIVVAQAFRNGSVAINTDEWPELRAAIDRMIGECRDD